MVQVIEYTEPCRDEAEANRIAEGVMLQVDALAALIHKPSPARPYWWLQVFSDATGIEPQSPLPDGLRFCYVPDATWAAMLTRCQYKREGG